MGVAPLPPPKSAPGVSRLQIVNLNRSLNGSVGKQVKAHIPYAGVQNVTSNSINRTKLYAKTVIANSYWMNRVQEVCLDLLDKPKLISADMF